MLGNVYSDHPGRAVTQALLDLLVIVWVLAWLIAGHLVRTSLEEVAQGGYSVRDRATTAAERVQSAQDAADRVPLLGDQLGKPFAATSDGLRSIADAGTRFGDGFTDWAWPAGLFVALLPLLAVVPLWLYLRWRFARRARAARALAVIPGGTRLLALRALATIPMRHLVKISPDPLGAFERGDPATIERLARLELAACGVRRGTPLSLGS